MPSNRPIGLLTIRSFLLGYIPVPYYFQWTFDTIKPTIFTERRLSAGRFLLSIFTSRPIAYRMSAINVKCVPACRVMYLVDHWPDALD